MAPDVDYIVSELHAKLRRKRFVRYDTFLKTNTLDVSFFRLHEGEQLWSESDTKQYDLSKPDNWVRVSYTALYKKK